AAARPGSRVLNAADADAPTAAEIGAAIDAVMGVRNRTTPVDGPPPGGTVGQTPWSVPRPVVLDVSTAERELGHRPARYAESLPETVEWLTRALRGQDWRERFPVLARAYPALFDYAAEDAWRARA
ncbi:NAD(P)-dependent oxidoreductase, partial [Streptomyces sp. NPDC004011]